MIQSLDIYRGGQVPPHLDFVDVRRLIDACLEIPKWQKHGISEQWQKHGTGERNQLFIETLWQTGARVGEVLGIRPGNLDARRVAIYVQILKRKTPLWHWVRVEPELITRLMAYTLHEGIAEGRQIFNFTPRMARLIVKEAASQAKLPSWVHPHTLRHSHAMFLRRSGVHAFVMQEALGHASLTSTLVYGRASEEDTAFEKSKLRWS